MKIEPDKYELYLQVIRTGQMPDQDVPKVLEENPDFAKWYRERITPKSA